MKPNREIPTVAALLAFLASGLGVAGWGSPGSVLAAMLWSMASLGCGFTVGFLFAVPRAAELTAGSRLKVNNNLVEVSDWLTKIIVGLGLIHLTRVPGYLERAGYYVGAALKPERTGAPVPEQFAAGLILYFGMLGFIGGYLVTRLFLGPAFREADEATAQEIQIVLAAEVETVPGERKALSPSVRAAAERLAALPLAQVPNEADTLAAWARAKLDEERYAEAVEALQRAVRLNPGSPRIRYLLAMALKYRKAPQAEVVAELEAALRLVAQGAEQAMRDRIYISYTFNSLFLPAPDGFTRARKAAEEYLTNPGEPPPPEIWINLACAYGQEHDARAGDAAAQADLRGKALHAVQRVIAIDPSWKPRLIQLLNEDDLKAFREQKEFRDLLGLN